MVLGVNPIFLRRSPLFSPYCPPFSNFVKSRTNVLTCRRLALLDDRRAADVEGELKKIAGEQNKNTDTLVELVKENGRIQAEMQVGGTKITCTWLQAMPLGSPQTTCISFSPLCVAILFRPSYTTG